MNLNFKYIFFIIFFLFSCEDNKYLNTENDFPLKVEKKVFTAQSIKNLFRSPSLLVSNDRILGRYTYYNREGDAIYRMYVRPLFTMSFKTNDYRKATYDEQGEVIDYLDEFKFTDMHKFTFRVDSSDIESNYNKDFNSGVKLKVIKTPMFGDAAYLDKIQMFKNSRYSEMIDPDGERALLLGETGENVVSSVGSKSTYEIDITTPDIEKLFSEYKDNDNATRYTLEGLMLDYDFQSDGMITIDTMPNLVLARYYEDENHVATDSIIYETVNMIQTHLWINYERLIPENEEHHSLRFGDRSYLQLNFNPNEIRDFLNSNKIFGAQLKVQHISIEEDLQTIFASSIVDSFTSEDSTSQKYIDGYQLDSVLILSQSTLSLASKESNNGKDYILTDFSRSNFGVLNDSYFSNWINNRGDVGKVMLGSSLQSIGLSNFPNFNASDSAYQLIIYYSENIE